MYKKISDSDYPKHIAFIMDGNRRWAKKNNLPSIEGHKMGSTVIKKIVKKSILLKIKYLTFFSFSTENWKRKATEVKELQNLLTFYLNSEFDTFIEQKIKFVVIGDIKKFNKKIRERILSLQKITQNFKKLNFILALNYGSRNEIIKTVNDILNIGLKKISEKDFSKYLMTSKFPDPDLVIRTSGEMRISNFLLWQIAYSELYFTKTLWPDFNSSKYEKAIKNFVLRKRRFGSS